MIKWNKKICVAYITELKSPFEEQGLGRNGNRANVVAKILNRLGQPVRQLPQGR